MPVSSSQRLKGLLSRGWRSVLQILEPAKNAESEQSSETNRSAPSAHAERAHRDSAPGETALINVQVQASAHASIARTLSASASVATSTMASLQRPDTPETASSRRASVLARAKELEDILQRDVTPSLPRQQLQRSTSTTSSLARRFATPDASSYRPILSLPRRSLGSSQGSPSVKSMIQSLERSLERDESTNPDKTESPVSHELRRLSSRRSVSGKSSLREVLEASMGGTKHAP